MVDMKQAQRAEQRLLLTQAMRQSLGVLQMALPELREYIQDQALSNPLLEIEETHEHLSVESLLRQNSDTIQTSWRDESLDDLTARRTNCDGWKELELGSKDGEGDFTDQLYDQLLGMKWLSEPMKGLCEYLILCLNDRGYLEFELSEIAHELQVPMFDVEQALYIVQSLQPAGVGARTLSECLVLQLTQGKDFNARTLRAVQDGLELVAKNNIAGLAKLLSCTKREAQDTAEVIRKLEPFPTRGYGNDRPIPYQISEASIQIENGQIRLEWNHRFLPRLTLNKEITKLLQQSDDVANQKYLEKNTNDALQLMRCLENRQSTVERLMREILRYQEGFFLRDEPLKAMTMGDVAEHLGLSISTVSRTVHDKNIVFQGRSISLRDLFTVKLTTPQGDLSSSTVKRHISQLIQAETPSKPLSDEQVRSALEDLGVAISRRTVAKYREELGIPGSSQRRQRGSCEKGA